MGKTIARERSGGQGEVLTQRKHHIEAAYLGAAQVQDFRMDGYVTVAAVGQDWIGDGRIESPL